MADDDDNVTSANTEAGPNRTDPIPATGGKTKAQLDLERGAPGLDGIDSELYSAMVSGDEQYVRSRFGAGSDRRLSEAEALILIRTRQEEEERAYADWKAQQDQLAAQANTQEEKRAEAREWASLFTDDQRAAEGGGYRGYGEGGQVDSYGGYTDKNGDYYDRYGGHYDGTGYQAKNGDYYSNIGGHYDAKHNRIYRADGSEREAPPDLQAPEEKLALTRADAAVAAFQNGQDPNAPMTDEQRRAAAGQPGAGTAAPGQGGAGSAAPLSIGAAGEEISNQMVRNRGDEHIPLSRRFTREEFEHAKEQIAARRHTYDGWKEHVQAGSTVVSQVRTGSQAVDGLTAMAEGDALQHVTHVHTSDLAGGHGAPATTQEGQGPKDETWFADRRGGLWDDEGGYYDNWGGYWDADGGHWDKDNGYMDKYDNYTYADGSFVDAKNNYVDKSGNLWAADGNYYAAQPGVDYKAQLTEAVKNNVEWKPPQGCVGECFLVDDTPPPAPAANAAAPDTSRPAPVKADVEKPAEARKADAQAVTPGLSLNLTMPTPSLSTSLGSSTLGSPSILPPFKSPFLGDAKTDSSFFLTGGKDNNRSCSTSSSLFSALGSYQNMFSCSVPETKFGAPLLPLDTTLPPVTAKPADDAKKPAPAAPKPA